MLVKERVKARRLARENATIPQAYDCPLEKLLRFCEAKRASGVSFAVSSQPAQ
jgi:hypothetical protein